MTTYNWLALTKQSVIASHMQQVWCDILAGSKPKKQLAAWRNWTQLQDSFSSGRHEVSVKKGAISSLQPRFQDLVSTTFPAQCLLETNMQVKLKTADEVNIRVTGSSLPRGLSTATRLVLKR